MNGAKVKAKTKVNAASTSKAIPSDYIESPITESRFNEYPYTLNLTHMNAATVEIREALLYHDLDDFMFDVKQIDDADPDMAELYGL